MTSRFLCLVSAVALPLLVHADITLPPLFGDNMVFQRAMPLTIWGTADKGEKVTALLGGREIGSAVADHQGRWKIQGEAPKAGPLPDLTLRGKNSITLKNLLGGEVWLCSGQSNMQMTVTPTAEVEYGGVIDADEEVKAANYPDIRFFKDKWEVCSPETVKTASAASYFFGRTLYQTLNVPIGLVTRAVGGTAIEFWVGDKAWTPELEKLAVDAYRPFYQFREELYKEQNARLASHQGADRKASRPPIEPEKYSGRFSKLFVEHIAPLAGFPMRGVLWYQGETNTSRSGAYTELLTALIQSWRKAWGQPDMPFVVVQLTNYEAAPVKGGGSESWPVIRAKQAQVAASVPHVILASTLGAGDPKNLHPRNKQEIGRRAGLRALDLVYGQPVPRPPALRNAAWTGSAAILTFTDVGGGFTVKGSGAPFFEVAAADGIYFPAQVSIEGDSITVASEQVKNPVHLRYAWLNNPPAFLYNTDDLALPPFELKK